MRTFVISLPDALVSRLAALVLQVLRGFQHGERERAPRRPTTPSLLTHLPGDAVLLTNGAGVIVGTGGNVDRLLAPIDGLIGTPLVDLLHPDDRNAPEAAG